MEKIKSFERLQRLFLEGITILDLAEPLILFDETQDAARMRSVLDKKMISVAGILREGQITGYVVRNELLNNDRIEIIHDFDPELVLPDSPSIPTVVAALSKHEFCFTSTLGQITGVVTLQEFEKPAMRMWLFGIITIIEMNFIWAIHKIFPNNTWEPYIASKRFEKAEQLLSERRRMGVNCDLVDCLQFSDKAKILINNPEWSAMLGFQSRSEAKRTIKELEKLRNSLAHSRKFIFSTWKLITKLVERLDKLLEAKGLHKIVALNQKA